MRSETTEGPAPDTPRGRSQRRRRVALVSLGWIFTAVAFACGSEGGAGAPDELADAARGNAVHDGATREATTPPFDAVSPFDAATDVGDARAPTWCDTLSPRPVFCADFDGVDPWAGWNVAPLTTPWPLPPGWGSVGLTDAGVSSPPHALDVTFLEDSIRPPHISSRATRGYVRLRRPARRRITFGFDLTVLAAPGPSPDDVILGGVSLRGTPDGGREVGRNVDLLAPFPDDEGRVRLYAAWQDQGSTGRLESSPDVFLRVGVRERVELSVLYVASSRWTLRLETISADGSRRLVAEGERTDLFMEEDFAAYVENLFSTESPRWRAIWDNVTFHVE